MALFLSISQDLVIRILFILMASSAVPTKAGLVQLPASSRAARLPGGGISSYSLGSDHLSLRLPVNCSPAAWSSDSPSDAYRLRAPFHILYVEVTFLPVQGSEIDCLLSHGDVDLKTSVANFSLGLGPNSLTFLARPKSVSSPTRKGGGVGSGRRIQLHIRRLARPQLRSVKSHNEAAELRVCQLIQECDFVHSQGEQCGLASETTEQLSWPQWLHQRVRRSLPDCHLSQLASGARWQIPCASCDAPETCAWRLARWWHPDCRAKHPDQRRLRRRLDGVRVVFLGDSTLRGLMFSLYREANGSLHRWEKSHDTLVLPGLAGRSVMAFSYYPQFWLPPDQAPSFQDSLRHILDISQIASGGFNKTAIVIGGAQWLTGTDLEQTRELLDQLGLAAPVIVKDLSPGFHIRVPGVTHRPLTAEVTQRLAARNSQLHWHAASLGFSVLPTFRLTAARYREFHPGKCACHFHTVVPRRQRNGQQPNQTADGFDVDGDIHRTCLNLLTATLDWVL